MMNATVPLTRFPQAHKLSPAIKAVLVRQVETALGEDPRAVEKAIRILFARQTAAEKAAEATVVHNNLGVQACHGRRIAYYGKWLASGRHLTGWHLDKARAIAQKYARTQLFELAALKAGLISA